MRIALKLLHADCMIGLSQGEAEASEMTKRIKFDIVLWSGASLVGKLVAEHFRKTYGVDRQIRWVICGRNQRKLEDTRAWLIRYASEQKGASDEDSGLWRREHWFAVCG